MRLVHILLQCLVAFTLAFVFVCGSIVYSAHAASVTDNHSSFPVRANDTYELTPGQTESPVFTASGVLTLTAECANDDTGFGLIVQVKEAQDGLNTVVAEPFHSTCIGGMSPTTVTANVQGPVFVDAYSIVDFDVLITN